MNRLLILAFCFWFTAGLRAAEIIGSEALLSFTDRIYNGRAVHWKPGSNEVVALNPPEFSWPWRTNMLWAASAVTYTYVFQVSYNADMSSPVVNVTTPYNFYNAIDHFTSTPVYWRVGYIDNALPLQTNYSSIRNFSIPVGTKVWDRATYLAPATLATLATRPRLSFNPTNHVELSNFFKTGPYDIYRKTGGPSNLTFATITGYTNQSWWNNPQLLDPAGESMTKIIALACFNAAICWQVESNRAGFNVAALCKLAEWAATNALVRGYNNLEAYADNEPVWFTFPFLYDWLYSEFTPTQKANVLALLDDTALYYFNNAVFWTHAWGPTQHDGIGMIVASHASTCIPAFTQLAISAYEESTNCHAMLEAMFHYIVGLAPFYGDDYCLDRGSYSTFTFNGNDLYGAVDYLGALAAFYHGMGFTNCPSIYRIADFYRFYNPVGMRINGDDEWGDGGEGYPGRNPISLESRAWQTHGASLYARLSYSPTIQQHVLRTLEDTAWRGNAIQPNFKDAVLWMLYPTNAAPTEDTNRTFFSLYGGWCTGMSTNPSSTHAFSNSVGFKIPFRPQNVDHNHTFPSDGHPLVWAYGARVTSGGAAYTGSGGAGTSLRHFGFACNLPLVDACSESESGMTTYYPPYQLGSRFTAYKLGSTYQYVAGNTTSNLANTAYGATYGVGSMLYVTNIARHWLFMRETYFVQYDDLGSTSNSMFADTYWVQEPTLTNLSVAGWTYTSSNLYNPSLSVTTRVENIATSGRNFVCLTNSGTIYGGGWYSNAVARNPWTGKWFDNSTGAFSDWFRNYVIYMTNIVRTPKTHFLKVIYPTRPGDPFPTITRSNDLCFFVTNNKAAPNNWYDIVTFDTDQAGDYTLMVDIGATNVTSPDQTAQPVATPGTASYDFTASNVLVHITVESGAGLYWTTNGTTATVENYNGTTTNCTIKFACTLSAVATNASKLLSDPLTAIYTQYSAPVSTNRQGELRATTMRVGTLK